jgi:hypothetical protein
LAELLLVEFLLLCKNIVKTADPRRVVERVIIRRTISLLLHHFQLIWQVVLPHQFVEILLQLT